LATVVHEDGTPAKMMIKESLRLIRSEARLARAGVGADIESVKKHLGLPLKRIIDTVHFAEKSDAGPLQLADLCAFILARGLKDKPVPVRPFEIIWKHLQWEIDAAVEAKIDRQDALFLHRSPEVAG
jgi:hypothetical protein